ncbi:MAG: hypothetical protein KDB25_04175 [Leucobacter sp.]|nr:hypothetical protein [Leucobacter sp.]
MVGHERNERAHAQRAGHLPQLIAHQLRVHGADDRAVLVDQLVVVAGLHGDVEALVVELRLEPGVVEVRVERVELVLPLDAQGGTAIEAGVDAPQQIALLLGVRRAPIRVRVLRRSSHRFEHDRGPAARARGERARHDEALVFEHMQVLAGGVDVDARLFGEFVQAAARLPLHGVQQLQTARLRETAEILDAPGHILIIGADGSGVPSLLRAGMSRGRCRGTEGRDG